MERVSPESTISTDAAMAEKQETRFSSDSPMSLVRSDPTDKEKGANATVTDGALTGNAAFEAKSKIISDEINRQGMGRYQWCVWFLAMLGYFVDLLWAQAFGLVALPLQNELGFQKSELGNIFTAFSAGLTAGAFFWGVAADVIGRRWSFNITVFITSTFGLALGACNNYSSLLVITAFVGFGIGGNIPIDTTLALEVLPQNRRFLLAMLSIGQPIGVVVCTCIAYGFIPKYSCAVETPCNMVAAGQACCTKESNMGWRYLMFTLGAITLFIFFLRFVVFHMHESPRYWIYHGRDDKALKVMEAIAKYNKTPYTLSRDVFEEHGWKDQSRAEKKSFAQGAKHEFRRFRTLFISKEMTILTLLVWVIYIFDYWGFSVAGSFLPYVLAQKNTALDIPLLQTYRDYCITYVWGIPGVLLGVLMINVPVFGRKWTMVLSSAMMGVSLFVWSTINSEASNIGLSAMEYFFQSLFNAVLYGWTPEAFPAPIRGTACGIASFWGRLASIVAPLIAAHVLESSINGVLYLAGGPVFICTIAAIFLPMRTTNQLVI